MSLWRRPLPAIAARGRKRLRAGRPAADVIALALLAMLACGLLAIATAAGAASHTPPARAAALQRGVYVAFCPGPARRAGASARAASTSHAGWPPDECLKMDKDGAGRQHTLAGEAGVHNWLLGGYGDDTIFGGERGDVIWGDYHPAGEPADQTVVIHAGNGRNFIYANDTHNYVWTGTNPLTVVHAHNPGTSGIIHCQSPAVVVYLSKITERSFKLHGCHHISHFSVGY